MAPISVALSALRPAKSLSEKMQSWGDIKGTLAAAGFVTSVLALDYCKVVSFIAGAATAAYMILHAIREYKKLKREEKEQKKPDEKNHKMFTD